MPEDLKDTTANAAGLAIELEDAGPCKKKLSIEIPAEKVNVALRAGINELQKRAALPGFRKGHAPLALIEKRFGGDLKSDVKGKLVLDAYRQALAQENLQPITEAEIDVDAIEIEEGRGLKFEFSVEVWPEFDLDGYEGMELEKPSTEPADDEVATEIENLQARTTKYDEVEDEPAGQEDILLADYTIATGEKELASAKDVGVRVSDELVGRYSVEGLKDALTGKKTGETVNVDFKVAEDHFEESERGLEAQLTVNIKGVRRPNTPEATDEWAKELGFQSLEELKSVVARNVSASKEAAADTALRRQVYEKLLEQMNFDLPTDAVARQQKDIFRREQQGLQYRGATEEDLAKINDELGQASLERSERDLKTFFILSRIAEKEDIHATPADVDMRIAEIAQRYRTTTAKMRQQLERDGMLGQIALQVQEEKTVAHILSKAKITNAAPPEGKKQPKEEKPKKPKVKKAAKKTVEKSARTDAKKTAKKAVKKASSKKAGSKSKPKDE